MTITGAPALEARPERAALAGLCIAGCAMMVFVAAGPWFVRNYASYAVFIPALAASGLLTVAATRFAAAVPARIGLPIILVSALAMRLLLVGEPPLLSTDIYRYIWDGRVQASGINPYVYVPADPALAALRDTAIYPHINRADYAVTAYPPLAQMFFLGVTRIAETLTVMRLAMVACEIVIVALVIDLLRRLALPVTAVVAYAWHPLAIWESASSGHVEVLMVALIMLGVWLLVRSRRIAGAVAVALAAVVKPYAVLILPAFWRPLDSPGWDWRVPLAVIAAIVVCYLAYLGAGRGVFGFLTAGYLSEEGLTSGEGIWLVALAQAAFGKVSWFTAVYMAVAGAIMAVLGLRSAFGTARTSRETIVAVILLLTAGLFLMSPNYAWYFLALVPFIPLGAGAPAWALTLGAFALYKPIFLPGHEIVWKSIATLPFLIALAWAWRSRTAAPRPAVSPRGTQATERDAVVSVVIPCLNEEEPIAGVVAEVLAQGVAEVIVVDNGSTDATAERARAAGATVVSEPRRGYGRACSTGLAAIRADADIVCFLDGDGSDVPDFVAHVIEPVARGEADFVMGSRLRGKREPGSMTPQQLVAGRLAGWLLRLVYGAHFTDMSPFRAMRVAQLRALGMSETTYGWNLEMQMRVAAAGLRALEIPVDHRCRRGGVSKVSGNLTAGLVAGWKIATTFIRLALTLRKDEVATATPNRLRAS